MYAFNDSGELLMAQEHKGTLDIPGGGREKGETIDVLPPYIESRK